jgi:hypothetical protein
MFVLLPTFPMLRVVHTLNAADPAQRFSGGTG